MFINLVHCVCLIFAWLHLQSREKFIISKTHPHCLCIMYMACEAEWLNYVIRMKHSKPCYFCTGCLSVASCPTLTCMRTLGFISSP